jgi:hypothetical protein
MTCLFSRFVNGREATASPASDIHPDGTGGGPQSGTKASGEPPPGGPPLTGEKFGFVSVIGTTTSLEDSAASAKIGVSAGTGATPLM